jgi:hypothetical protein
MKIKRLGLCFGWALLTLLGLAGAVPLGAANELPAYMKVIVGGGSPNPAETARQNVLALNSAMFALYDASSEVFRDNILSQHPVILARFSGAGGRFVLYRPGWRRSMRLRCRSSISC